MEKIQKESVTNATGFSFAALCYGFQLLVQEDLRWKSGGVGRAEVGHSYHSPTVI